MFTNSFKKSLPPYRPPSRPGAVLERRAITKVETTGVNDLPNEILFQVHGLLPQRDLSSAVLVNKKWRKVGEDPSLWTKLVVKVSSEQDVGKISIRRLAKIQKIGVKNNLGNPGWKKFFLNVEKLHKLEHISGLRDRDLTAVEAGLLARVLMGVESVELWSAKLTTDQVVSLVTHLAMPASKTKKLVLDRQDLSSVPSHQLSVAYNKLEEANLYGAKLKTDQLTAIFRQIINNETNLKALSLRGNDLSGVAPDILATAISKVKKVSLASTRLSTDQLNSIFELIVEKETEIKILWLVCNDVSGVDKDLFSRAKDKLSTSGGEIWVE